ncbi:MAG TPA: SH3 domain-containing protein [Crinalium sp.]|jgi:uncharacterized protein YgiM (DUF1202 family)
MVNSNKIIPFASINLFTLLLSAGIAALVQLPTAALATSLQVAQMAPVASPQSAQAPPTREPECQTNFRIVAVGEGSRLNVRDRPNSNAGIVTTLANGTEVLQRITNRDGDWAEIYAPGGSIGWVATRYLTPSPIGALEYDGTMQVRTLDGDRLNVRESPSPNARVVETLINGTVVPVVSLQGYWVEIKTPTRARGFVLRDHLVCD